MKESDYKRRLVAAVIAAGGHARRVEDRWAVGVLDLIIKLPGLHTIMAEGKIINGNIFGPTLAQFEEGQKWIRAGTPTLLLGWRAGVLYVSPWVKRADIRSGCMTGKHETNVIREHMMLTYLKETATK